VRGIRCPAQAIQEIAPELAGVEREVGEVFAGLGPVQGKAGGAKYKAGQIAFLEHQFSLWDSYGLSRFDLRAGSFAQDARGRWYLNMCVKVDVSKSGDTGSVGIDLGLKTAATCSDGEELASGLYRKHEAALGIAQRAKKKCQVVDDEDDAGIQEPSGRRRVRRGE
jgi:hypothetical protein